MPSLQYSRTETFKKFGQSLIYFFIGHSFEKFQPASITPQLPSLALTGQATQCSFATATSGGISREQFALA